MLHVSMGVWLDRLRTWLHGQSGSAVVHADDSEVERALKLGFPRLLFPPTLEQRYRDATAGARLDSLRFYGWLAIFIAQLTALPDWWMVHDQWRLGMVVRLCITLPAIGWWMVRLPHLPPALRERGILALTWVLAAIQVVLVLRSTSPLAPAYLVGLSALVLVNGGLLRVRFWDALLIDMGLLAMFLGAASLLPHADPSLMASIFITLTSTIAFSLWGAYRVEHAARTFWLKSQYADELQQRLQARIDRFASLSRFDALTGLPNRREALHRLSQVWSRALRDGRPVSILLMDVDHFKRYNDHHGHPAGDACLQRVATALAACLSSHQDVVARWGGEEFLAVLVDKTPEEAHTLAGRMVQAVAALGLPHEASTTAPVVTVSVGLASAAAPRPSLSPAAVIQAADQALYQAKAQGRNRCVVADQSEVAFAGALPADAHEVGDVPVTSVSAAPAGEAVEAALRRLSTPWSMPWFPRQLEKRFWRDQAEGRIRGFLVTGVLALLVFNLFAPVDYLLARDVWREALVLRLGLFTPFWAGVIGVCWFVRRRLARQLPPWLVEMLVLVSGLSAGACLSYVLGRSHSPLVQYYHVGLMVVMVYGNLVQRLRFWAALVGSGVIVAMHVHGALTAPSMSINLMVPMIALVVFSGVFSLVANHAVDRDERRNFLMGLRSTALLRELDRVEGEVSKLSRVDPLTGLYNRRHLDEALAALVARAPEADGAEGVAAIIIDVDHFKRYNDHHGHPAGDLCLQLVAEQLQACVRGPSDFVARMGGEEFVAIVCPASPQAALQVAERMRDALHRLSVPHGDSPTAAFVTASMGVAWMPRGGGQSAEALLKRADEALYRAKQAGRDRVCLADEHPPVRHGPQPRSVPAQVDEAQVSDAVTGCRVD